MRLSRMAEVNGKNFGEIVTAFNRIRTSLVLNKDYMVDPTRNVPTFLITESGQEKIMQEVLATSTSGSGRLVVPKQTVKPSQFVEISDFCKNNSINEIYLRGFIRYHYVKFSEAGLVFEAQVGEKKKLFLHPKVLTYKRNYRLTKAKKQKTKGIYAIMNDKFKPMDPTKVYTEEIMDLNKKVDILTDMMKKLIVQKDTVQSVVADTKLITLEQRTNLIRYMNVLSFVNKVSMKDIISGVNSIVNKEQMEQYTEDDYKSIIDYLKREYRKIGLTLK